MSEHSAGSGRRIYWIPGLFLLVTAAASLFVLFWFWPEQDADHRLEVTKAALQVLGVAVLGGLAALALAVIQQDRANQQKARDERAEQWHREGDALESLASETIAAYNELKSIRRMIRVDIKAGSNVDFQVHMQRLSLLELEFERFRRIVPFTSFERDAVRVKYVRTGADADGKATNEVTEKDKTVAGLAADYDSISTFLGPAVTAFEGESTVPAEMPPPISGTSGAAGLGDFLGRTSFRNGVTMYVNVILEVLLRARLSPLPRDLDLTPSAATRPPEPRARTNP